MDTCGIHMMLLHICSLLIIRGIVGVHEYVVCAHVSLGESAVHDMAIMFHIPS